MSNLFDLLTLLRTSGKKTQHALDQQAGAAEPAQQPSSVPQKPDTDVFSDYDPENSTAERAAAAINAAGIDGSPSALDPAVSAFSTPVRVIPTESESTVALNATRASSIALSELPHYIDSTASSGDILPYGVKSVWRGLDVSEAGNVGTGTYAFVIDSGVNADNSDLNVNTTWSKSFVDDQPLYDGNGHGTHVAGTIAALANGQGVVGVAPGAEIISLKVYDSSGSGPWEPIINAVEYAAKIIGDNDLDRSKTVVNLSLGGAYDDVVDKAIRKAADQGIRFAIAAGNWGGDADYFSPASAGDHENVYTVSAVDNTHQMAWWSNWDDPAGVDDVDVAAPGVDVLSYYYNNQLTYLSGTSMAAPHVAGLLLMGGLEQGPMVKPNDGGYADPFALIFENLDQDGDGFVDDSPTYRLTDGRDFVQLTYNGSIYSDASSPNWDAIKAVQTNDSAWTVLLQGTASKQGQWFKWDIKPSGEVFRGSGWRSTTRALEAGWEEIFGDVIYQDGIDGVPTTDENGDGLVDDYPSYRLTNGDTSVSLTHRGRTYSDASSPYWNAIKAVRTDSGWSVLLQGTASKQGQWMKWDIKPSGEVFRQSSWRSTTRALEAGWEEIFGDVIHQDSIIGVPTADKNEDGLVDNYPTYRLIDGNTSVPLTRFGRRFSNASSPDWDAIKAVRTDSGWSVLLQGTASKQGQWMKWDANTDGRIFRTSRWRSTTRALEAGWEEIFADVIKKDGTIGVPGVDQNGDGLVDNYPTYRLIDGNTSVPLTRFGRRFSNASSPDWDAIKAVRTDSGWSVLLQGTASKQGQWMKWDANADGRIFRTSRWHKTHHALQAGWDSIFGDVIKKDGIIGSLDQDGDGFVDKYSNYHLTDGSTYVRFNRYNKYGNFLSDDTSDKWNAVKAVKTTSGWSVLLQGTGDMEGQWNKWNTNANGQFMNGSGWQSTAKAVDQQWETLFGLDIDSNGAILM